MQNLLDAYRFVASDGVTDTPVTPINTGLKFRWERQDDGLFFRQKLQTPLVFRGADYTYFRAFFDADECTEVTLTIERKCGGVWETRFEGVVPIFDAEWDFDRCEVVFKLVNTDAYECLNREIGKKINWLDLGDAVVLKTLYGTYEYTGDMPYGCFECGDTLDITTFDGRWLFYNEPITAVTDSYRTDTDPMPPPVALPGNRDFRPYEHNQFVSPDDPVTDIAITTEWVRETVTSGSPPPGVGWTLVSGTTYVRPALYATTTEVIGDVTDPLSSFLGYHAKHFECTLLDVEISNGRVANDLIEAAILGLNCGVDTVISNFFGINADATNPSNSAYDFAADNFQTCLIFQKSDITNEDASDDATILEMSLKELLDSLRDGLNVWWAVEEVAGDLVFRIEHYSYFEAANGLDLVALDGGLYVAGLNNFKIESETPAYEENGYAESFTPPFMNKRIEYPAACATGQAIDRSLRSMCADLGGLLNNPNAGTSGFVFICADLEDTGIYQVNRYGDELNGAMQWRALHDNLWAYGRYRMDATSTASDDFAVETIIKRKAQAPVSIPWCCEDEVFNPVQLIQTGLGWGAVKQAEEDTARAILTLNLLHE